jgi:hypothetical protein
MGAGESDSQQVPSINSEETQRRHDGDGTQSRSAVSGTGASNSGAVAGNSLSGNTTRRGDIIGGNKSGHNISFGGIAVIIGIIIGVLLVGRAVIQGSDTPSPSSITANSTCADYSKIEDPSSRLTIINRLAVELGNRGVIGSPVLLSEVDAQCATSKDSSLGTVVGHAKGY